jgi:hypothetical protein
MPSRNFGQAWELQALGQRGVLRLVRDALDELLEDITLACVHEREQVERAALAACVLPDLGTGPATE